MHKLLGNNYSGKKLFSLHSIRNQGKGLDEFETEYAIATILST